MGLPPSNGWLEEEGPSAIFFPSDTTDPSTLPIPRALYPCLLCAEDWSKPAKDLHWSARKLAWICLECWCDEAHGKKGPSLAEAIKARIEHWME